MQNKNKKFATIAAKFMFYLNKAKKGQTATEFKEYCLDNNKLDLPKDPDIGVTTPEVTEEELTPNKPSSKSP